MKFYLIIYFHIKYNIILIYLMKENYKFINIYFIITAYLDKLKFKKFHK